MLHELYELIDPGFTQQLEAITGQRRTAGQLHLRPHASGLAIVCGIVVLPAGLAGETIYPASVLLDSRHGQPVPSTGLGLSQILKSPWWGVPVPPAETAP